jgi:predicted nucleic acid-binding protein
LKVVDTTFLIGLLRNDPGAVEKAMELDGEGGAATTAVNVYEVAYGVHRAMSDPARRMVALERLLSNLDVLPLDQRSALRAAEISGSLDRKGDGIDPFDSLIAGIALEGGADCLVTRNASHFGRIRGLKIEGH